MCEALIVAALVAAIPGLVLSLLAMSAWPLIVFYLVALIHGIVLGIPLFLLLRWRKFANPWTCAGIGALAGATPIGALTFPIDRPQYGAGSTINGLVMTVNGIHTPEAWLSYMAQLLFFGGLGAASAAAFWFYVKARSKNAV